MENIDKIRGFVALIDVLGFRELVGRDNELSQVQEYIEAVTSVLDNSPAPKPLQFVLFSDNLVINTRDDGPDSFKNLVIACSHLSYQLAQRRVAVRGAIAHGPFMRSPTTRQGVILAGRPIVEADHYQHIQNWVGTVLAPSVVRQDDGLKQRCAIPQHEPEETRPMWADRHSLAIHLQDWGGYPSMPRPPSTKRPSRDSRLCPCAQA